MRTPFHLCLYILVNPPLFFLFAGALVAAQPLSTESRWIVDESGHRVKLTCVNWPSHLEVMVAEGLSKKPVDVISKEIVDMGFNCVRLTWPLFLFTDDTLASTSVRQSFKNLGLIGSISGFQKNNPSIIDLTLIRAYQAVVASLAKNNVMIVLDNHTSKPGWCCGKHDGNGFFGDKYFDPDLWIKGLTKVATIFNCTKNVVAMSLRNELRGPDARARQDDILVSARKATIPKTCIQHLGIKARRRILYTTDARARQDDILRTPCWLSRILPRHCIHCFQLKHLE